MTPGVSGYAASGSRPASRSTSVQVGLDRVPAAAGVRDGLQQRLIRLVVSAPGHAPVVAEPVCPRGVKAVPRKALDARSGSPDPSAGARDQRQRAVRAQRSHVADTAVQRHKPSRLLDLIHNGKHLGVVLVQSLSHEPVEPRRPARDGRGEHWTAWPHDPRRLA